MGYEAMNLLSSDIVHTMRTFVGAGPRGEELLCHMHHVLVEDKRALLKRTRTSSKTKSILAEFANKARALAEGRVPSSQVERLLLNFANAPHRHDSELQGYVGNCVE